VGDPSGKGLNAGPIGTREEKVHDPTASSPSHTAHVSSFSFDPRNCSWKLSLQHPCDAFPVFLSFFVFGLSPGSPHVAPSRAF